MHLIVQRRAIALVLADLLRTADDRLDFLRPQAVVGGSQSADPGYYVELCLYSVNGCLTISMTARNLSQFCYWSLQPSHWHQSDRGPRRSEGFGCDPVCCGYDF